MPTFRLLIATPEHKFLDTDVEQIVVQLEDGLYGVLAGHADMVAVLDSGVVRIQKDGAWRDAFVSEGFVSVSPEVVTVMAQSAEWPAEIDARRAEEAKDRAEERLRQKQSQQEYMLSKASLARAMARLRVSKDRSSINH